MTDPRSRPVYRRQFLALLAGTPLAASMLPAAEAQSASYPAGRPIRIICPYPAGSPVDVAGRYMAELLHAAVGTAIVDNISGAGGTTGTGVMLRAPADGLTLLTQFTSALVCTQLLYRTAHYDALKDFIPLWSIGSSGTVLVVSGNSPYKSLPEFLAAARSSPGKLTFGSSGVGSPPHINAEMFMRESGIKMAHIPYRGSAQIITDIMSGQVDCEFASIASVVSLIQSGKLRGLAVLRNDRAPELPQVATLNEGGVHGWEPPRSTFALFARAGTPPAVVDRLAKGMQHAFAADTAGQERISKIGLRGQVAGQELAALLQREYRLYKKLIDDIGIQPLG